MVERLKLQRLHRLFVPFATKNNHSAVRVGLTVQFYIPRHHGEAFFARAAGGIAHVLSQCFFRVLFQRVFTPMSHHVG